MLAYLVHDTKDNMLIVLVPPSKLLPESLELRSSGGGRVTGVSDDGASGRLLRRVVVTHVVVRVQDSISTLVGDGSDGIVEIAKVRLVETCTQAILERAHAFEQEGYTEGVDLEVDIVLAGGRVCYQLVSGRHDAYLVLINPDVHRTGIEKGIIDIERAWQTSAVDGSGTVDTELAT